jgi:D-3-phosphoglycerate dehydrogenase
MKLLVISDAYIPAQFMLQGLQSLEDIGVDLRVCEWKHDSLIDLQEANLAIEQDGPGAIEFPAEFAQAVQDADILVVQFAPVSRSFLEAASALKAIGVLRGGTESVDVPFATERGIAVLNMPGRNARAVAECTLGLILAEVRNIARSHASLVHGKWQRGFPNEGAIPELNEKTVGLVGYGAVGRLVAHYLEAFGSRILTYDPYCQGDPSPAELVDLTTLLQQSDVVSLHARLTKESHHLIGRKELALMKPTAVLINTARSGLVDESALVDALAERQIMGAALDVFETEPLSPASPLLKLDNATLTPHIAGSTVDAFRSSPKLMAGHLRRMLCGEGDVPIVNSINPWFEAHQRAN